MTPDPARLAWLEQRRSGVGASDVAGIMGRSPWASPYSIWADKVGLAPLDEGSTRDQELGRELEGLIARWFHEDTGLWVAGEQMIVRRPGTPWFATVDGVVVGEDHEPFSIAATLGVFEAKKTDDRPDQWEDGPPEHYVLQCQWAMFCSGLPRAWLVPLHLAFGHPVLRVHVIEADPDLQAAALEAATEFWGHVERREPPPADASRATTRALAEVHANPDEGDVELDPDALEALHNLRRLKSYAESVAESVAEAENVLRAALGDHAYGRVGGRLAVSWKPQTSHRIDTKAVRRDHGTAYDRESTTRVLRLHGEAR